MLRRAIWTGLFAVMVGNAQAAGLGKLTVLSALGKPLQAELEVSATVEELLSLSAQIASAEVFAQKGLERSSGVASIQFSLERRQDGTPFLRAVSDQPIQSSSVNLLVELNWAAGRVLREYTFLLDPPAALKTSTSPPQTATLSIAYLVKRGDTLGEIANETRPEGVHLAQVLVALFNANREAFDEGNMNRIQAGRTLNIPDAETVKAVDLSEARKIIVAQAQEFDNYRGVLATTVTRAPSMPEETQQHAGKVMPKVEEKKPSSGGDKLTVSRTENPVGTRPAAALEEDLVAREKELQEASGRVTKLEKTVGDLKQLAELKEQSPPPVAAQPPQIATVTSTPTVKTDTLPPLSPSSSISKLTSGVMDWIKHPVVIGSIAALFLIGLGWGIWRRRSKDMMTPSAPLGDEDEDEDEDLSHYVVQPIPDDEPLSVASDATPTAVEPEITAWEPSATPPDRAQPIWSSSPVLEVERETEETWKPDEIMPDQGSTDWKPADTTVQAGTASADTTSTTSISDISLEFDKPKQEPDIEWQPRAREMPPLDFSEINLELERPDEKDEPEVTTKLELAQAYEEMGDIEGARELLKEVLNEGNRRQREAAEAKLLHLGDI